MMATCCSPGGAELSIISIAGFDTVILAYAVNEAKRIREKIPADFSPIARFFVIMRPFMHVFLLAKWDWGNGKYRKGKPGKPPYPKEALLLIHLISHLGTIRSYRQVCEEIANHADWIRALKLKRIPDHTTLSKFRKEAGPTFFDDFFAFSIVVLKQVGGLDADNGLIVDSAPVDACVNFARANKRIKIDEALVIDFLVKLEISKADVLYPRKRKGCTKSSSIVGLLIIFYLCRFLSRSQMLREVALHPALMHALGLDDGMPTQPTINYFVKQNGEDEKALLKPFIDAMVRYFEENPSVAGENAVNVDFFSGRLATQDALPDPDARIGYNVAKDKAYIGYKCHAIVGNASHAFYGTRITPANTSDAKHFMPLMEQAETREIINNIFLVHGDCAYHVETNLDWLKSRQIDCKFHDKDESGLQRKKNDLQSEKARFVP
jgi:hypothetical protein